MNEDDQTPEPRQPSRRRRVTTIGAVVAAVALIVSVAALANHQRDRSEARPPATQGGSPSTSPTPAPSPSASASPTSASGQQPPEGVLDVSDLPTGAPPGMDYVYQDTFHFAGGDTSDVRTRFRPWDLVELADGARIWQTIDDRSRSYIEIQDTDGGFHDPVRSRLGLSVNRPHSIVAWLTPTGQVMIWEGWASEPRPLGDPIPGSDLRLGPITGDGEAAPGQAGPDCATTTCTVIITVADRTWQPWEARESGSQPLRDGGFLDIKDVSSTSLAIGLTEIKEFGSCSTLMGGGEFQGFTTCKHTLRSFSPDGQLIQGTTSYPDGAGDNQVAMYDLDGTLLFTRGATEQAQPTYHSAAWEDDTHLLMPVHQDGKWSLVRIASDGSMEYAVAPRRGVDVSLNPYVIPTGGGLPTR